LDHQPEKEFTFQQTWGFPNPTKWSRWSGCFGQYRVYFLGGIILPFHGNSHLSFSFRLLKWEVISFKKNERWYHVSFWARNQLLYIEEDGNDHIALPYLYSSYIGLPSSSPPPSAMTGSNISRTSFCSPSS
jgi:hypothetical protein